EAERVRAEVAAASVREREDVGRTVQLLDDLERGGLLPLEAERVERVDEDMGARRLELLRLLERLFEVRAHLHLRADGVRLRELAAGDGSLRLQDHRL